MITISTDTLFDANWLRECIHWYLFRAAIRYWPHQIGSHAQDAVTTVSNTPFEELELFWNYRFHPALIPS